MPIWGGGLEAYRMVNDLHLSFFFMKMGKKQTLSGGASTQYFIKVTIEDYGSTPNYAPWVAKKPIKRD